MREELVKISRSFMYLVVLTTWISIRVSDIKSPTLLPLENLQLDYDGRVRSVSMLNELENGITVASWPVRFILYHRLQSCKVRVIKQVGITVSLERRWVNQCSAAKSTQSTSKGEGLICSVLILLQSRSVPIFSDTLSGQRYQQAADEHRSHHVSASIIFSASYCIPSPFLSLFASSFPFCSRLCFLSLSFFRSRLSINRLSWALRGTLPSMYTSPAPRVCLIREWIV